MQINVSSVDENLNLYDSGHRFEHIQLLVVLLRTLPYASRSFQARAIQVCVLLFYIVSIVMPKILAVLLCDSFGLPFITVKDRSGLPYNFVISSIPTALNKFSLHLNENDNDVAV
jgi:hypothetical protein